MSFSLILRSLSSLDTYQTNLDPHTITVVYQVSITNTGERPAQLLSRHWIITDGMGSVEHVRGDGVVGEQPIIQPEKPINTSVAVHCQHQLVQCPDLTE